MQEDFVGGDVKINHLYKLRAKRLAVILSFWASPLKERKENVNWGFVRSKGTQEANARENKIRQNKILLLLLLRFTFSSNGGDGCGSSLGSVSGSVSYSVLIHTVTSSSSSSSSLVISYSWSSLNCCCLRGCFCLSVVVELIVLEKVLIVRFWW